MTATLNSDLPVRGAWPRPPEPELLQPLQRVHLGGGVALDHPPALGVVWRRPRLARHDGAVVVELHDRGELVVVGEARLRFARSTRTRGRGVVSSTS